MQNTWLPDGYLAIRPVPEAVARTRDDGAVDGWDATALAVYRDCRFKPAPEELRNTGAPPAARGTVLYLEAEERSLSVRVNDQVSVLALEPLRVPMLMRRIRQRESVTVLYTPTRPDGDWNDECFGRALAQQQVLWADVEVA